LSPPISRRSGRHQPHLLVQIEADVVLELLLLVEQYQTDHETDRAPCAKDVAHLRPNGLQVLPNEVADLPLEDQIHLEDLQGVHPSEVVDLLGHLLEDQNR